MYDAKSDEITNSVELPSKIIAVSQQTKEEILIFDASAHGYNGLFVDSYDHVELEKRKTETLFKDGALYEIFFHVQYGINYNDETHEDFVQYVDKNGNIEVISGKKIPFEEAKRNGFDYFEIIGKDVNGEIIEILSEELA